MIASYLELWRNHIVRSKQIAPRLQVRYLCDSICSFVIASYLELWRNHVVRSKQIVPRLQVHYRFDLILWNLH